MLNELGKVAYRLAVARGFYGEGSSIPGVLCILHSEVSEAVEAYRDGAMSLGFDETGKPVGFPSELADLVTVAAGLACHLGIDLDEAVRRKLEHSATRPFLHGRKVAL